MGQDQGLDQAARLAVARGPIGREQRADLLAGQLRPLGQRAARSAVRAHRQAIVHPAAAGIARDHCHGPDGSAAA
jgi:hypothetical protein